MSGDFFGISSGGNQSYSDMLVESFKRTQAYRVDTLTQKKNELQSRQNFYNGLNSRLNTLIAQLDKFGEYKTVDDKMTFVKDSKINDSFKTRTATLSEKEFFSVSTKGDAIVGSSTVKVQRLATNDVLVSKQLSLAGDFGGRKQAQVGDKEFKVSVGDESFDVKVSFTGEETNEEAMTKIVNAINNTKDIKVSASLVKDTETTGRISLVSKESGESNQITLTSNSTTELLGWDHRMNQKGKGREMMQGADAGFKRTDPSELNAKFEVNGIEITRNKNEVDDVLPGTTIKLLKVQSADAEPVTVTTEINPAGVESLVDAMVKEFNGLLFYLNSNKNVQKTDPGMSSLQSRLRSIVSSQMSFLDTEGAPNYITDIGYKINNDGTLVLNNKDKLKEFLMKDGGAEKVAALFTSETGLVAKINEAIVNLKPQGATGEIGLIKSRNESIRTQILNLEKRITTVESSIDQQAQTMRKEYENYLKVYLQAQGQYSLLSTMPAPSSGGYNSLLASQYSG